MVVGTKGLEPFELDTFADDRLVEELHKAKEELFNLRFQSATGQLEHHGRIRAVKKDIARISTVLRERELGMRVTPVAVETTTLTQRTRAKKASDTTVTESAKTEASDSDAAAAKSATESATTKEA